MQAGSLRCTSTAPLLASAPRWHGVSAASARGGLFFEAKRMSTLGWWLTFVVRGASAMCFDCPSCEMNFAIDVARLWRGYEQEYGFGKRAQAIEFNTHVA